MSVRTFDKQGRHRDLIVFCFLVAPSASPSLFWLRVGGWLGYNIICILIIKCREGDAICDISCWWRSRELSAFSMGCIMMHDSVKIYCFTITLTMNIFLSVIVKNFFFITSFISFFIRLHHHNNQQLCHYACAGAHYADYNTKISKNENKKCNLHNLDFPLLLLQLLDKKCVRIMSCHRTGQREKTPI